MDGAFAHGLRLGATPKPDLLGLVNVTQQGRVPSGCMIETKMSSIQVRRGPHAARTVLPSRSENVDC